MSKASDTVYQTVRAMILDGAMKPGAQVTEEEIADICGVSRTPVREAIRRLEAEMFIERTDSQRSFVSSWTDADIDELFTLRAMLESYAAERAAKNITDEQIAALTQSCDRMKLAVEQHPPGVDRFLEENALFHGLVLDAAASERLAAISRRTVLVPIVMRTARKFSQTELRRSHQEHVELVSAFQARDPVWAAAVMTAHIRRAFRVNQRADAAE